MTGKRRSCPESLREPILRRQDFRCLYCQLRFGSVLRRRAQDVVTAVRWDHRIPFAYLGSNPGNNWAAACQVCNSIKSDALFDSLRELRTWIRERWIDLHIEWLWQPDVSSEQEPELWASRFAAYLASGRASAGRSLALDRISGADDPILRAPAWDPAGVEQWLHEHGEQDAAAPPSTPDPR